MSEANDFPTWPPRSDDEYRAEAEAEVGAQLAERLAAVKLLVFDADGVLTGGNLIYSAEGEALKEFHAHDGLGLVLARTAGLKLAVLTGRNSQIVKRRCTELRFDSIKLGRFDKVEALNEILSESGCTAEQCLYMGDDLIDLPAMHTAGLAITVPEVSVELADFADYQTTAHGGKGAVREVVELVLKSSGLFGLALTRLVDKAWQPTKLELSSNADGGLSGRESS
jgi:3-deoxy-D-manno-octulosonate 8-phosphate phosphatase (KDO 8-P phosphatase)